MNTFLRFLTIGAALLFIVPAASADWFEDFDSYAAGSGLHGQGGWAGWHGSSEWDAFVTDVQARSAPNSVAINPTSDIVQGFNETKHEWEMTAWCYIPTGSTGRTFFIMLNRYYPLADDWSVQYEFDTDAGILTTTMGDSVKVPIIYDQWVEVRIEINLNMNAQRKYYDGVELEYTQWNRPSGVTEIAALDLFSDGASDIYWDDCSLVQTSALEQTTWGSIKAAMQ